MIHYEIITIIRDKKQKLYNNSSNDDKINLPNYIGPP